MSNPSLESLLQILRDRDVSHNQDFLKSKFEDIEKQTSIQVWLEEYLGPETLLTKEEAALYTYLSKSGEAETLAASQDLSAVHSINEHEVHDAIKQLKRSTAAIEKQTETLRLQQNAMSTLLKSNARNEAAQAHANKSQRQKWNIEKDQNASAVGELSQSLRYQISDLDQQSQASESDLKQSVDSILRSDDKLLSSLQKLAGDLHPVRSEDEETISRIRNLCARLIKHTVEGIRTRLDRIYLDALVNSTIRHGKDDEALGGMQDELESLYSEILPVAQMSAEQQFLGPAVREIAAREVQAQKRCIKAINYIKDCLDFLVNRLEVFRVRAEEYQSHKMALQYVIAEVKQELERLKDSAPKQSLSPVKPNTERRGKSSGPQSPVRARNMRRRSSGQLDVDIEPEEQLLRSLGVSVPSEATTDAALSCFLDDALSDRRSKLEGHTNGLQATMESSVSSHLSDAQTTLQLLRDSLLSDTRYHKIQFLDPEIESSVAAFEKDVLELQGKLPAISLQNLQERNVHRDQFVERWLR